MADADQGSLGGVTELEQARAWHCASVPDRLGGCPNAPMPPWGPKATLSLHQADRELAHPLPPSPGVLEALPALPGLLERAGCGWDKKR